MTTRRFLALFLLAYLAALPAFHTHAPGGTGVGESSPVAWDHLFGCPVHSLGQSSAPRMGAGDLLRAFRAPEGFLLPAGSTPRPAAKVSASDPRGPPAPLA